MLLLGDAPPPFTAGTSILIHMSDAGNIEKTKTAKPTSSKP